VLATLVRLATATEDATPVLAAAERALRRPLALVDAGGEALGHAPANDVGRRAVAVARAMATERLAARKGWRVVPVPSGASWLGLLAIGPRPDAEPPAQQVLEALIALLADQLRRASLLEAQRRAFVRRLVSARCLDVIRARREAEALGLALAAAYRPHLLGWRGPPPPPERAEALARHADRLEPGGLVTLADRWLVLLAPRDDDGAWASAVVARARALAPEARPQALAADRDVAVGRLGGEVARLAWTWGLGGPPPEETPVLPGRRYALATLLGDHVRGPAARSFVEERIGRLTEWDRTHGSALAEVLEAALDHPRHDLAARCCHMHRNTFRRHLRQACDVLGEDLDDPDARLAVHVALKLRRWLAAAASGQGPDERAGRFGRAPGRGPASGA
jgi:hypothetical protein